MRGGQQAVDGYHEAAIATADRGRLLLLFFDGALRFLKLAREALVRGDPEGFGQFLGRAQAVIAELMSTLDPIRGGNIARDLERLYDFMLYHLTEANLRRSAAHIEDVIRILGVIADAFRRVIEAEPSAEARS